MRQTDNADECFLNADVAILVGSMPRREGQQRADLLAKNGAIFQVPIYASRCRSVVLCLGVCVQTAC